MMCRLLHSIPRGLRLKAQANINHAPRPGSSGQSNRQSEDNLQRGRVLAPPSNDPHILDPRSTNARDNHSLVRSLHCQWHSDLQGLLGKSHWESYGDGKGTHTAHDALTWGASLALSLHLSRVLTAASLLPGDSDGEEGQETALAQLVGRWRGPKAALNLTGQRERPKAASESAQPKHKATSEAQGRASSLATAASKLQAIQTQALGQAHNSLGVALAREGDPRGAAGHFLAGSRAGFGRATFNLAVCHEQGCGVVPDLEKAAALYEQASQQGHAKACYNLGVFHLTGKGGVRQDTTLALDLIQKAAAGGVKQANLQLGIHFLGTGDGRDEKKAVKYLQKAVDDGEPEGQFHLGLCLEHGWGLPANTAKAASLYRSAAERNHQGALYSLARFHRFGLGGLPVDTGTALALYQRASDAGHCQAAAELRELKADGLDAGPRRKARQLETASRDVAIAEAVVRSHNPRLSGTSLRQTVSTPDLIGGRHRGQRGAKVMTADDGATHQLASSGNWLSTSDLSGRLWQDWATSAGQQPGLNVGLSLGDGHQATADEETDGKIWRGLGSGGDARLTVS